MAPNESLCVHDNQDLMDNENAMDPDEEKLANEAYYFGNRDDLSAADYHDLYLQKYGFEFMMPILFEDGMDYVECELYYASLTSQLTDGGSILRRPRNQQPRRPSKRELMEEARGKLQPCLKESNKKKLTQARPGPAVRRCSFSGMPQFDEVVQPLARSNSMQRLEDDEPRVAFEEYVQVVTIHPVEEYPPDVRSRLWMSREEMSQCMRRAMVEEMREQRERQREQREKAEELLQREKQLSAEEEEAAKDCKSTEPLSSEHSHIVEVPH